MMNLPSIKTVFPGLGPRLADKLENRLSFLSESLAKNEINIQLEPDVAADLVRVCLFSEFAASCITKNPGLFKDLVNSRDLFNSYSENSYIQKFKTMLPEEPDSSEIKRMLLEVRLRETIRIAWRDLSGKAELEETLADLSNLADAIVGIAIDTIYDEVSSRYGYPVNSHGKPQRLIVLGMGKLGAGELNFSSDIDLIFVYPETGATNGDDSISNEEFFTKLCRQFLKFFSPGVHDINFYRIDARLRPYGDGGPIVMSASAFEEYYQAQGREWERYAMIKARPIAGDIDEGNKLLKVLNAFIYRRYFDYGSFDSFRDMKHRITLQVKSKKLKDNIKLGAGGIREIEFFGQLFQLIRGGVEPRLQERKILKVLDLLVKHNCINETVSNELKESYVFLRHVENRLQAYADRQTHDIPQDPDQREILALSMGCTDWPEFEKKLEEQLGCVHYHFQQLLVSEEQENPDSETQDLKEIWVNINDPQFAADEKSIGKFEDPGRVLDILRTLEAHPNTKQLSANGRKKLSILIPVLVKKIGEKENPEAILIQLIDLIIAIERRTTYLSLLIENKGALETLITLAQKSPWIITFLSRHPALMDELMHPASLYFPPGKKTLQEQMFRRMSSIPEDDLEIQLEELCIFRQINMLRVAAADVSGNYPLMKVSDHLTWIAETVLSQVLKIAWNIVAARYGTPEGVDGNDIDRCGFAALAYGKVGGLEMGYKSDIDIVFLYKADPGMTRGTDKPIEVIRFYTNIGTRIINALTMHTPAGTLYGADMRLRPGGDSGTIVTHIDAYEDYLENEAWTWEHQALIRARCIAGDKEICDQFNGIRHKILSLPREGRKLKQEVGHMRERMREDRLKPVKDRFDLKQSKGSIVDIEFLVQYLILKEAHTFPDLTIWTDNMRLLESLDGEGIITGCESERLQDAYISMRKTIHRRNLQEKDLKLPEEEFSEIRRHVRDIYQKYLGSSTDENE